MQDTVQDDLSQVAVVVKLNEWKLASAQPQHRCRITAIVQAETQRNSNIETTFTCSCPHGMSPTTTAYVRFVDRYGRLHETLSQSDDKEASCFWRLSYPKKEKRSDTKIIINMVKMDPGRKMVLEQHIAQGQLFVQPISASQSASCPTVFSVDFSGIYKMARPGGSGKPQLQNVLSDARVRALKPMVKYGQQPPLRFLQPHAPAPTSQPAAAIQHVTSKQPTAAMYPAAAAPLPCPTSAMAASAGASNFA